MEAYVKKIKKIQGDNRTKDRRSPCDDGTHRVQRGNAI